MNKTILMGRFTKNPHVTRTQGDNNPTTTARFTLAVNRRFKRDGGQDSDFISCVAFGRTAEFIEKYFSQGTKAVLSGRIQTGSYTNKDGIKIYTTDVVVEEIDFAESKKPEQGQGQGQQMQPQAQPQAQQAQPQGYASQPQAAPTPQPVQQPVAPQPQAQPQMQQPQPQVASQPMAPQNNGFGGQPQGQPNGGGFAQPQPNNGFGGGFAPGMDGFQ